MIVLIFVLFNPLYALAITAFFSVFTKQISNLLIAVLYALSFSILLSNQEFLTNTDLGQYIEMYQRLNNETLLSIFKKYLSNPNGREFIWFWYSLFVGKLSGFSSEVYLLTTYFIIYSLSAYLVHLVCENRRYNFPIMLFSLIFLEVTFLVTSYDLWRNLAASLILLIGIMRYNSFNSKLTSRFLIYSSALIHTSMLPCVAVFELYALFFISNKNKDLLINYLLIIKITLFIPLLILLLINVQQLLIDIVMVDTNHPLYRGFDKYSTQNKSANPFAFSSYIRPIFLMFAAYFVFNLKKINKFDVYILILFIILEYMSHFSVAFTFLYSRATILINIGVLLIATKVLKIFDHIYIFVFILIIFAIRMYLFYTSPELYFFEEGGARSPEMSQFLNPINGLLSSIFYFYNPSFDSFQCISIPGAGAGFWSCRL